MSKTVRRCVGLAAVAGIVGATFVSSASGASSIVSIDVGQAKAEIATTVRVRTISEVATAQLSVKYRAAGGPTCAPTPATDPGDYIPGFNEPSVGSGDVTTSKVVTFSAVGAYQLCGWLRQSGTSTYIATTSGAFAIASPVGSITGVAVPGPVPRGRAFVVTISGQTEVARKLLTAYRPASQPPCAASPKLDPAYGTYGISSQDVFGAFTKTIELTFEKAGSYRLCSWVATDSSDLAPLGVNETIITVPAPIVVAPVRPKITRLEARGRRLTTKIRLSKPGKLRVTLVRSGRRIPLGTVSVAAARTVTLTYRRRARIAPGRFVLEVTFTVTKGRPVTVRKRVNLG